MEQDNNTHYFDDSLSPQVIVRSRTPRETTFNNNIFYAAGSGSMGSNANNGGSSVTYDTNVYNNITPPSSESNAMTQDPRFYSPGAEPYDVDMEFGRDVLAGYMLSSNSPYLNSGLAISNNGFSDAFADCLESRKVNH